MIIRIIIITLLLFVLPTFARAVGIGDKAPAFELSDMNGKMVGPDSFRGKVILVNFWAVWCTACRAELPELETLYSKYKKAGFEVIGISLDQSPARVANFVGKVRVSFPILIDDKGRAADKYRFSGLPSVFLIGRDGIIKFRHAGFGKEFVPLYEKEILELLKQQ